MASSWKKRLRRGRVGWLGRIDGVEKPALLVGLGLVLYRVWKAGEPGLAPSGRWRQTLSRWRKGLEHSLGRIVRGDHQPDDPEGWLPDQEVPDGPAGAAQGNQRQEKPAPGHPLP
jgi:hypothetical protein